MVATGTSNGDGYRLTAARRLALAALGALVLTVQVMAGPSYVAAAANYTSEVRFDAEPTGPLGDDLSPTRSAIAASCGTFSGALGNLGDASDATGWSSNSCTSIQIRVTFATAVEVAGWRAYQCCANKAATISLYTGADASCNTSTTVYTLRDSWTTGGSADSGERELGSALTSFCYRFNIDGLSGGWHGDTLALFEDGDESGPPCHGTAGPGADGQLVWGSASLTSPTGADQWGHQHLSSGACLFTENEVYHFTPAAGFTEGDTYSVGIQAWGHDFRHEARVALSWVTPGGSGGSTISMVNFTTASLEAITSLDAYFAKVDTPPGVSHISISVGADTMLAALLISNVEGDAVLDNGENPWTDNGTIPPVATDYFADCEPPADPIDVPGWLEYGACIVVGGFTFIGDLMGTLIRNFVDVWDRFVGPWAIDIGGGLLGFVGAMVSGVVDGILGVLEFLFVPVALGDDWQAFLDTAETRVPFGWWVQVEDTIQASAATGSSGLGAFNLTIGSATVSIGDGIEDALAGVSPYRGLIFAGVALVMVLGCLRWIMAAVGVSPGGGAHSDGGGAS